MKKTLYVLFAAAMLLLAMTALPGCSHCGAKSSNAKVTCAGCGMEVAVKDAVALGDGQYACSHCAAAMAKDASGAVVTCAGCGAKVPLKDAVDLGNGKYACSHCAAQMGKK